MKTVAVLGTGPAGYFAALAALNAGARVTMYGLEPKQRPKANEAGVFILHSPMNLPLQRATIQINPFGGDADAYQRKVYGREACQIETSYPRMQHHRAAWDGEQGLSFAYDIVSEMVRYEQETITAERMEQLSLSFDLVINTISLRFLYPEAALKSHSAWVRVSSAPKDDAFIIYNAHPDASWYRCSAVFGRFCIETARSEPNWRHISKVAPSEEALSSIRDTLPSNVVLAGRFGTWDKAELSHHGYWRAMARLGMPVPQAETIGARL